MTISSLLKSNFTPIIFTLFVTLQITACSTEDLLTTVAPDIGSNAQAGTSTDTQTATTADNSTDQTTSSGGTDSGTDQTTSSGGTDSSVDQTSPSGSTDSGSVTLSDIKLSWVAPAEREDNTALSLSEISAYKIYYGTVQGQYSSNVLINDGSAVGHTFTDFASGTYYFVITTSDTGGRESKYSQEIQVTI